MKRQIIIPVVVFFAITFIWIVAIYCSGWQIHRCFDLTGIFIGWVLTSIGGAAISYVAARMN